MSPPPTVTKDRVSRINQMPGARIETILNSSAQMLYDSAGLGSSNLAWSRSIGRLQALQVIGGLP